MRELTAVTFGFFPHCVAGSLKGDGTGGLAEELNIIMIIADIH
jgi:hypothetical protein